MKKGFYSLLLSLFCIFTPGCQQTKEVANEYNLVPLPNQMTPKEGRFQLNNKVAILTEGCAPEVKAIADGLAERVATTSGITLQQAASATESQPVIRFVTTEGLEKEAYRLSVSPEAIVITASEPNGFFYGVQTIYQLLPIAIYGDKADKRAAWSVPAVEIEDAPRFGYRGMHLDPCRHFIPLEYTYRFIDLMAIHKMNTLHWHLTDDQGWRIEIKKYPKLTEVGSKRKHTLVDYYFTNWPHVFDGKEHSGYYTQEEIKDVVAYAASKYITVIPEIEMPGHAIAALASYPELSCRPDTVYEVTGIWGIFEEVFCPKEETFTFLEGVIDEVIELFPSSYIHVGGDECPKTAWKNCAHCQGLIKKLGLKDDTTPSPVDGVKHSKEDKLQSYFITRMEKYINSKGRNIIGWDEILEGGLAPNATVMSWRGVKGGLNAARAGHDVVMTPSPHMYLDYYQEDPEFAPVTIGGYETLKKVYSFDPVPEDADELVKKHIIGFQGNTWSEYMYTLEKRDYQIFPRALVVAETAWTLDENKDWESFCKRLVGEFDRMDLLGVNACRNFFDVNVYTNVLNDNGLHVRLETYYPDAEIYYSVDGTEPSPRQIRYEEPFLLEGNIDLKAAAFKDGKMLGKVIHKPLYGNLISGKKFLSAPRAGWMTGDSFGENDYLGADPNTLGITNGKRGNNASYTPWTSHKLRKDNPELEFVMKFDAPQQIRQVVFGTLFNPAYRILPAKGAVIEISADGESYQTVAEEVLEKEYPERGRKAFTDVINFDPVEAQYVKIRIQGGGTLRNGIDCRKDTPEDIILADLYVDEIEIY